MKSHAGAWRRCSTAWTGTCSPSSCSAAAEPSGRLIISQALVTKDFESTQRYTHERAAEYPLFWQLTHLTRDKGSLAHDDRVDALAIACGYFAAQMAQDTERRVEASRDALMKEELARYMKRAIGWKGSTAPVFARARTL